MSAYELAKAQQAYAPPTLEEIIKQQADRISELEKENAELKYEKSSGVYDAEPYGYLHPATGQFTKIKCGIPLYTTPQVKPRLSDEEIENIYWSLESTGYDGCFSFIEFARAIEERLK